MLIRPLVSWEELRACEDIQREVWGEGFTELVPASLLKISQSLGGVTSGAFDEYGALVGFVYGLTGLEEGRPAHWSHMLAVRPGLRGHGIGTALKRHQRERLVAAGVASCYWTYDPIVSGNARLNLERFLAVVDRYVVDMYGETGSRLHAGLGTDRFVVAWPLGPDAPDPFDPSEPERAARAEEVARHAEAPVANPEGPDAGAPPDGRAAPDAAALPEAAAVRVAIPADILAVRDRDLAAARRWRATTRRAFTHYLERGYRVAGYRVPGPGEGRGHYVLVRGPRP